MLEEISKGDLFTYVIFIFMIVEGFVMMFTGKTFFYGVNKYEPEGLEKFSKKAGIGYVIAGVGILLFSISIDSGNPNKYMIIGGLVLVAIGIVIFSIMHKKYLVKK